MVVVCAPTFIFPTWIAASNLSFNGRAARAFSASVRAAGFVRLAPPGTVTPMVVMVVAVAPTQQVMPRKSASTVQAPAAKTATSFATVEGGAMVVAFAGIMKTPGSSGLSSAVPWEMYSPVVEEQLQMSMVYFPLFQYLMTARRATFLGRVIPDDVASATLALSVDVTPTITDA